MDTSVATAWTEIVEARHYTRRLLEGLLPDEWFWAPTPAVTHIAWQVGHLAMAQYRLALERIRGAKPEDAEMISPEFLRYFGRGAIPQLGAAHDFSIEQILQVYNRVFEVANRELSTLAGEDLDTPPIVPHQLFTTKLGSLFWSARHEMLHAGQIGLLRRLMGKPPLW
jgi:hypothetical protein